MPDLWLNQLHCYIKLGKVSAVSHHSPRYVREPVRHSVFDVTRDGGAQLKAYQCVSKSTPISLVTSNKRLLYCSAHLINLAVCGCQDEVTTEEHRRQAG